MKLALISSVRTVREPLPVADMLRPDATPWQMQRANMQIA